MTDELKLEGKTVVLGDKLDSALEKARRLKDELLPLYEQLRHQLTWSAGEVTDTELGYHHLWLLRIQSILEDLRAPLTAQDGLEVNSERRIANVMAARESEGFVAFGKKFTVTGDLIPTVLKEEKPTFLAWMKASQWADLVREEVAWQSLKKLCNELAEKGERLPDGVKLSPRFAVRVR